MAVLQTAAFPLRHPAGLRLFYHLRKQMAKLFAYHKICYTRLKPMRTLKVITIVLITVVVVAATALFLIGFLKPKPGGIRIDTSPGANVYINGVLSGKTPFSKTLTEGQITLHLTPVATDSGKLLDYETKINITPGIETVVRREFGVDEDSSSGDVISFEKTGGVTSLVVISTPDNAQVLLDGVTRGFAPYKTSAISPGAHKISIKAAGFLDRTVAVNAVSGFQLTVFAKLAKGENPGQEPGASPSPTPTPQAFVEILTTPTGFLRVRTEPGSAGEEIAQVKPGDKFPYLGTDAATGWYKILYEEPKAGLPNGIMGWVSNQFSKIASPSATPNL